MSEVIALDASVIVSALLTWHEHHEFSRASVETALKKGSVILPIPALVESYAVMTRLPAPHRLSPANARALLDENFAALTTVEGLTGRGCWAMLTRLAANGVAGGRTYDAQILAVAIECKATTLLTLNVEDFAALASSSIRIHSPLA